MPEDLRDGILELVVDNGDLVDIVGLIGDDQSGNRSSGWESDGGCDPADSLGNKIWEVASKSVVSLPISRFGTFSPTISSLYPDLFGRTMFLTSRTIPELIPPHRPLSDVRGTSNVFLTAGEAFLFCRYVSFSSIAYTLRTPKSRPFYNRSTSCFILLAATIFIALVIFLIELTDFIFCFRTLSEIVAKPY